MKTHKMEYNIFWITYNVTVVITRQSYKNLFRSNKSHSHTQSQIPIYTTSILIYTVYEWKLTEWKLSVAVLEAYVHVQSSF